MVVMGGSAFGGVWLGQQNSTAFLKKRAGAALTLFHCCSRVKC